MTNGLHHIGQLLRYGAAGVAGNVIGYAIFLGFIWSSVDPVVASGLTYIIVLCGNYIVHRKWVFNSEGRHASDVPRYLFAYFLGLVTTMASMKMLSSLMRPELAQIFVILLSAGVIYGSLVVLRFGKSG